MEYLPDEPIIASRRIGIIVADGYDPIAFNAIYGAIQGAKAIPIVIGTHRSETFADGESQSGKGIVPDHHLEGQRSTMFDALFVPGGKQAIETLSKNGRALHYIREAFGHLKAIGATGEGILLVEKALQLPTVVTSSDNEAVESYGVVTLKSVHPERLGELVSAAKNAKGFLDKFVYAISVHRCWEREIDGLSTMVAY
ncbi:catalase-1 [Trichoderma harzianum]|uniref:catalase n=1 Tax=Trichoderma harzianum TaxID=5544 RepID=A0A0F9WZV6_TRIHA|nr:catalase-1 [Trichoderma harzianum]